MLTKVVTMNENKRDNFHRREKQVTTNMTGPLQNI